MLHLSDFVVGRKRFYNLSKGVYISTLEHCRKMKLGKTYLLLTLISKIVYAAMVE